MQYNSLTESWVFSFEIERRTPDRKVVDSILTRGVVLCPWASQFFSIAYHWLNPGSRPKMTEKLLIGT